MKKLVLFITGLACAAVIRVQAQSFSEIRPLHIGDTVPDITLSHIINYKASSATLFDFKGKLVILDFFATTCTGCIGALPRYDSLQRYFNERIKILPVTYENRAKVEKFLSANRIGRNLRELSFITGDTLLSKLFPHEANPHEVWIGPDATVRAITYGAYVNAANVKALLSGERVHWPVKREIPDFDYGQPLLKINQDNISSVSMPQSYRYSTLLGFLDGVSRHICNSKDSITGYRRLAVINFMVLRLYLYALGQSMAFPRSHMLLEGLPLRCFFIDSARYTDAWRRKYCYSYETVLPGSFSPGDARKKMLADLDSYLGLWGRIEPRQVQCFILSQDPAVANSLPLLPEDSVQRRRNGYRDYISLKALADKINQQWYDQPFINDTHFSTRHYVPVAVLHSLRPDSLRQYLGAYGLRLHEENRTVDMLVLSLRRP